MVWQFEGIDLENFVEETRVFDQLELVFRVEREEIVNIRPALENAGELDVVERIDGGFDTVDRSGTDSVVVVSAPEERQEVRPIQQYLVEDFEEAVLGTSGEFFTLMLELVPLKEKRYDNEHGTFDDAPTDGDPEDPGWYFEFENGSFNTRRVTVDLNSTQSDSLAEVELVSYLLQDEVRVLEENLGLLGATNLRDVPDGDNILEDVTDGRNTVTIEPPDDAQDTVEPGSYVVEEFETVYNNAAYEVTLVVRAQE